MLPADAVPAVGAVFGQGSTVRRPVGRRVRHGVLVRIAVVSESFLPVVNGVTNSVLRVLEHLAAGGHEALVIAPGLDGPAEYRGFPVVRIPAVELPMVPSMPVGVPSRRVLTTLRAFAPDVVHLAAPFVVGYRGLAAARRLGVPTVAVYQTDVASFASAYGLGLTSRAAWRWIRRLHGQASARWRRPARRSRTCTRTGCPGCTGGPAGWTPAVSPRLGVTRSCGRRSPPAGSC